MLADAFVPNTGTRLPLWRMKSTCGRPSASTGSSARCSHPTSSHSLSGTMTAICTNSACARIGRDEPGADTAAASTQREP
jgi:hypothetical protein